MCGPRGAKILAAELARSHRKYEFRRAKALPTVFKGHQSVNLGGRRSRPPSLKGHLVVSLGGVFSLKSGCITFWFSRACFGTVFRPKKLHTKGGHRLFVRPFSGPKIGFRFRPRNEARQPRNFLIGAVGRSCKCRRTNQNLRPFFGPDFGSGKRTPAIKKMFIEGLILGPFSGPEIGPAKFIFFATWTRSLSRPETRKWSGCRSPFRGRIPDPISGPENGRPNSRWPPFACDFFGRKTDPKTGPRSGFKIEHTVSQCRVVGFGLE